MVIIARGEKVTDVTLHSCRLTRKPGFPIKLRQFCPALRPCPTIMEIRKLRAGVRFEGGDRFVDFALALKGHRQCKAPPLMPAVKSPVRILVLKTSEQFVSSLPGTSV